MTHIQQDGSDLGQKIDALRAKRPISERKLRANRANAQRSTGPRTAAGKATSSGNALKHGILSRSLDSQFATFRGSFASGVSATGSALQEIDRLWRRLARVLTFENECAQSADGLERNARIIVRYERMLTRQLHLHIHECAGLKDSDLKNLRSTL